MALFVKVDIALYTSYFQQNVCITLIFVQGNVNPYHAKFLKWNNPSSI